MASHRAVFTAKESTQHPEGTAEGTPSDLSLSGSREAVLPDSSSPFCAIPLGCPPSV